MHSTVDITALNKFISSVSKSLQALCHGCMDFNIGIELIGHININIDSENCVDCVLNEKVRRHSENNSMTFISNSFLAKKEKAQVDGSCSPIPELMSPSAVSGNSNNNDEYISRKRHFHGNYGNRGHSPKRKYRRDILNMSDSSYSHQYRDIPPHTPAEANTQHDFNMSDVKQEINDSHHYGFQSPEEIKTELPNDDQTSDMESQVIGQSGVNALGSDQYDSNSNRSTFSNNRPSKINTESDLDASIKLLIQHSEDKSESHNNECSTSRDFEQTTSHTGNIEETIDNSSADTGQFDVIEIGDDDEDVQDLFPNSGRIIMSLHFL